MTVAILAVKTYLQMLRKHALFLRAQGAIQGIGKQMRGSPTVQHHSAPVYFTVGLLSLDQRVHQRVLVSVSRGSTGIYYKR